MSDSRGFAFIDFIVILILIVVGLVAALFLFTSSVTGGLSNSFSAISKSPGCIPSVTLDDCSECGGHDKCCYCPAKCFQADKPIKAGFDCGGLASEFAKINYVFTCNDTCIGDFCQCPTGCVLSQWNTVKKYETCLGYEPAPLPVNKTQNCADSCTDENNCTCPTTTMRNGINHETYYPECSKNIVSQGETCDTPPDLAVLYVRYSVSSTGFVRTIGVQNTGDTDFVAPFTVCFQGVSKIVDGLEDGVTMDVDLESGTSFGADGPYSAVVNCDPKTGGVITANEFNTENDVYTCTQFTPAQGVPSCV